MLRTALVGTGLIARKKHLPAWKGLAPRTRVVALCDLDRKSAEDLASRFGIPAVYTDVGELLEAETPDVVDICTPPSTHAPLAVQALEASTHVLVEKPMAVDVEGCDAIVEAAGASGRKVAVAHSDLFYPAFLRARTLVESGALGDFRGMRILLSTPEDYMTSDPDHWAHDLPGGVIGETGPHVVYMSLPFIGRVERLQVLGRKVLDRHPWSAYEDYRVELVGERGTSSIALTYATDQWAAEVELWGSEGLVRADLESQTVVRHRRRDLSPRTVGASSVSQGLQVLASTLTTAARRWLGRDRSTHRRLIERFVSSIEEDGPVPVSAEHGRETVRVMNEIAARLESSPAEEASAP